MKYIVSITFLLAVCCLFIVAPMQGQETQSSDIEINEYVIGTLLQPKKATKKLAIIIAGSGPTDRNGNSQMSRNNSLKLLAEGLAQNGIATYRYDKRVVTMMKKRTGRVSQVRFDDLITDAATVVSYFREEGQFSDIYLIGHSQGSLVAMVAAQQEEEVSGCISLAGPSQTIDETIIEQVIAQMPDFEEELRSNFETLRTTGSLENYNPLLASVFNKEIQPYMLSWMKYNPSVEITKISTPLLIINGTRDFQVSELDAERLAKAKPEAQLSIIKNMNHVLRLIDTDDLLVNQKSYQEPTTPIAQELVTTISSFLEKN